MKKQISRTICSLFAIIVIASISFSSCKDDDAKTVDKTALADTLTAANALLSAATEGVEPGQYVIGSKAKLQTAINTAKTINDDAEATQDEVSAATGTLHMAMKTFRESKVELVDQANLVAQWTFSEGSGTTVNDASDNGLDGTLMSGHAKVAGRGAIPTWVADRYGNAGKALNFTYGAHIEVPFNALLTPSEITVSVWVNVDTVWANNYILSEKWWEGWKFQIQDANKPFFTYKTNDAHYYDKDSHTGLPDDHKWHHIAVTLKTGEEKFYADGVLIYTWTGTDVDAISTINTSLPNPQTFVIGQEVPNTMTGIDAANDPSQWGVGYFKGSLDDIRIYQKALTSTQISSIYNIEKVPPK